MNTYPDISASPVVEQIRATVEARIRELQPIVAELEALGAILAAVDVASVTQTTPTDLTALLAQVQHHAVVTRHAAAPSGHAAAPLPAATSAEPSSSSLQPTSRHAVPAVDGEETLRPFVRRGRRGTKPGRDGRAPQGANKQRIIAIVLDRPGVTAPEIAELTGLKRTVVSATINRLKRRGELEPFGEGVRVPMVAYAAVA